MSTSTPEYGQTIIESVAISAVNGMTPCVTLADPMLFDSPLIGVSAGFEELTGYTQAEIIGQNCRFLNAGVVLEDDLRLRMRKAVALGTEFVGVLQNCRKDCKRFMNLLHMTTLRVQNRAYLVGIQVNVTDTGFDVNDPRQNLELQLVVDRIFQASLDVWIDMAASDFNVSLPVPYSQLLRGYKEQSYEYSHMKFVQIEKSLDAAMQNISDAKNKTYIYQKNTFMHVKEQPNEDEVVTVLRRCQSEPIMSAGKPDSYQSISQSLLGPPVARNLSSPNNNNFDSDSASSRPTEQPNDTLSDCSYRTDDLDSSYLNSRSGETRSDSTSGRDSGNSDDQAHCKRTKGAKEREGGTRSVPSGSSQDDTTDGNDGAGTSTSGPSSSHNENTQSPSLTTENIRTKMRTDWADWHESLDVDVNSLPNLLDPEPVGGDAVPPVLKSVGSAGHPTQCCECQFFFFSLTGCKKGQDCRYCHEFHPRAKEKKNRKLRRRLDEVGERMEKLGIEATHSFTKNPSFEHGSDQVQVPHPQVLSANFKPALAHDEARRIKENIEACAKEKKQGHKAVTQAPEHTPELQNEELQQLNEVPCAEVKKRLPEGYVPDALEQGSNLNPLGMSLGKFSLKYNDAPTSREFVFAIGQHVNLTPSLHSATEKTPATPAQKDCLTYSVTPPLPDGLELDPKTGVISGIVNKSNNMNYGKPVEHAIKVGVRVLAAWNKMVLGSLTLCEVQIKVRVVDLTSIQHQIRWIHQSGSNDDSLQIEFNDVECCDEFAWNGLNKFSL